MDAGWTITIDAAGTPSAAPAFDAAIDAFLTNLEAWSGAVNFDPAGARYGATFSLDEPDLDAEAAIARGCEIFHKVANVSGLPIHPIVHAQAMTYAEYDAELARPVVPELVGIAEIAVLLGVNKQRASALQTRADFPRPVAQLKAGPVWTRASLNHFADTWDRKPGRPKKNTDNPTPDTGDER